MILESKSFKEACAKILAASDKEKDTYGVTNLVEIKKENNTLYLEATNREYYVSIKFEVNGEGEDFKATVSAGLFLKLIAQITTDTIELKVDSKGVTIKANGDYRLPMILNDGQEMIELPQINILNPTTEMNIDSDILKSILNYNSRELLKNSIISSPIQKLHYIDEQGALTITSGICINNFALEKPIKILINNKIVKLFKLFEDGPVKFTLGYDPLSDEIVQTKVKFETPNIILTAILNCDNTLIKQVPVLKARDRVNNPLPYKATLNKNSLIQSISRLMLFTEDTSSRAVAFFKFTKDSLEILGLDKINSEKLITTGFNGDEYTAILDLGDLKNILDTCVEQYVTLSFGDGEAVLINRLNIINILPECEII